MEILFLGTSSGTPTKTRNVTGIVVRPSAAKSWCLIDCGEGTQHQILHTNLSLKSLTAILITHVHGDHCYGLPGLLASAAMAGRSEPLLIVGPAPIKRLLDIVMEATDLHLPYPLVFTAAEDLTCSIESTDFSITTTVLSHRVPCYAYTLCEKEIERKLDTEKLRQSGIKAGPIWRQLQNGMDVTLEDGRCLHSRDFLLPGRRPRKIVVAGDNDTPQLLKDTCADADVLVHEATYTLEIAQKVGPWPQHCAASTIAGFSEETGLGNLILTHFSARYQDDVTHSPSIQDIRAEAEKNYHGRLFLAKDFDLYRLDREGQLSLCAEQTPGN